SDGVILLDEGRGVAALSIEESERAFFPAAGDVGLAALDLLIAYLQAFHVLEPFGAMGFDAFVPVGELLKLLGEEAGRPIFLVAQQEVALSQFEGSAADGGELRAISERDDEV